MKVVFLDFDGVINIKDFSELKFDSNCIKNLNKIIKQTNADVVISSAWRNNYTLDELQELLGNSGFIGKIVGL